MRIGHGYDVHRYKNGRKCVICGVEIPSEFGPDGHSDADVATHALMDALLGAAAMGDIGKLFPDTDMKYKDISSMYLLEKTVEAIGDKGYVLSNADITIVAQRPKFSPYIDKMRQSIADVIGVDIDRISVKATTEEGLGFTGDMSGIAAHAVVLIEERD